MSDISIFIKNIINNEIDKNNDLLLQDLLNKYESIYLENKNINNKIYLLMIEIYLNIKKEKQNLTLHIESDILDNQINTSNNIIESNKINLNKKIKEEIIFGNDIKNTNVSFYNIINYSVNNNKKEFINHNDKLTWIDLLIFIIDLIIDNDVFIKQKIIDLNLGTILDKERAISRNGCRLIEKYNLYLCGLSANAFFSTVNKLSCLKNEKHLFYLNIKIQLNNKYINYYNNTNAFKYFSEKCNLCNK